MIKRIIIRHLLMIGGLLLIIFFIWKCPLRYLAGIPCPCCGMTRSFMSLLRLDIRTSLWQHPLLLPTGFAIWYLIHRNVLPDKYKFAPKTEKILGVVLLVLLLALYIYRIGFEPDGIIKINLDDGWLFKIMREIRG